MNKVNHYKTSGSLHKYAGNPSNKDAFAFYTPMFMQLIWLFRCKTFE
jgi:hypothetical protein